MIGIASPFRSDQQHPPERRRAPSALV